PYINGMWTSPQGLLRDHSDLVAQTQDWLVNQPPGGAWPIYYPGGNRTARTDIKKILAESPGADVSVRELPTPLPDPASKAGRIYQQAGLLYLPNSYVVPGGIFNEQYGWDSFFIIKGLLASAEYVLARPDSRYWDPGAQKYVQLDEQSAREYAAKLFGIAKGMADNHAFEINYYGGMVNNANRIYYLTRSQPPLFAHEVLSIYEFAGRHPELVPYRETLAPYLGIKTPTTYDEWIAREMLPAARTYFDYYTDSRHVIFRERSNLRVADLRGHPVSLYVTDGLGPVPEVTNSQVPGNAGYYEQVKEYFESYPEANPGNRFMAKNAKGQSELRQLYYRSDRATRASGYDLSGRFGYAGEWDAMYAPVDLQTLVYQFGLDLNGMIEISRQARQPVKIKPVPESQLDSIRMALRDVFWRTGVPGNPDVGGHWADQFVGPGPTQADPYLYATTLVPLWADGLVGGPQVGEVVKTVTAPDEVDQEQLAYGKNDHGQPRAYKLTSRGGTILACEQGKTGCQTSVSQTVPPLALIGEQNYGIPTSQMFTGNQWDYPNAWAPIQYFAADGLRRHGFATEAAMVDRGWLNAVDVSFAKTGILIEKYVTTNPLEAPTVTAGYSADQAGFGWTNAFYLDAFARQTNEASGN
ncbi:MAG: trehalase family glycosidase, partial [Candidatus Nanopelagicales bacterium]|nr:trehalase family glycosidase [Candidatus Nanopelagicales bacterium]